MLTYDYKCGDCHIEEEHLVKNNTVVEVDCTYCGGLALRQLAAPRCKLDGLDPGFPDAYDKWTRDHEKGGKLR